MAKKTIILPSLADGISLITNGSLVVENEDGTTTTLNYDDDVLYLVEDVIGVYSIDLTQNTDLPTIFGNGYTVVKNELKIYDGGLVSVNFEIYGTTTSGDYNPRLGKIPNECIPSNNHFSVRGANFVEGSIYFLDMASFTPPTITAYSAQVQSNKYNHIKISGFYYLN